MFLLSLVHHPKWLLFYFNPLIKSTYVWKRYPLKDSIFFNVVNRSKVISSDPRLLVSMPLYDSLPLIYDFLLTNRIRQGWKETAMITIPYLRLHLAGWYALETFLSGSHVGEFYMTRNRKWSRCSGKPPSNSQQKTEALNPIATRKWILSTWVSLEANSFPNKNEAWPTHCLQPCETLSRGPSGAWYPETVK